MSLKNSNKVIMIISALTGNVLLTIDWNDYEDFNNARYFVMDKIYKLIDSEEGAIIKIGIKG